MSKEDRFLLKVHNSVCCNVLRAKATPLLWKIPLPHFDCHTERVHFHPRLTGPGPLRPTWHLTNQLQTVEFSPCISSTVPFSTGVPQGCMSSPVFYWTLQPWLCLWTNLGTLTLNTDSSGIPSTPEALFTVLNSDLTVEVKTIFTVTLPLRIILNNVLMNVRSFLVSIIVCSWMLKNRTL